MYILTNTVKFIHKFGIVFYSCKEERPQETGNACIGYSVDSGHHCYRFTSINRLFTEGIVIT